MSWTQLSSNPLTFNQVSEQELKYKGFIEEQLLEIFLELIITSYKLTINMSSYLQEYKIILTIVP